ncbi:hypothetical protein SAMN02746089_00877 [Caldanaerobius fijiensis DSM 17918]|uniref:Transposase zinc-ribbon domain-containing protein n=1 Tax=Caldanaerobius fijiensis DSM 17918 TaxID=1121256 RepID=A0A1M4WQL3_9THEO|nr:hypothetical protein [Caldanaerobius fijiensis]SHE83504.1 hypothetical protein SAMN02746089_00877 [Caldanaerobius fijiensis DSM 17918]
MRCPHCKSTNIGKIGKKMYFCRDCTCEFKVEKWGALVYEYDVDGSVSKKYKVCVNWL